MSELKERREFLAISQRRLAHELGVSQAHVWRMEAGQAAPSVRELAEIASVLGLELSIALHEMGDPIRDSGQQALGKRFDGLLSPLWRVTNETLLPNPGDQRSWDKLLRLVATEANQHEHGQLVGTDLETRIRDVQALVRRTRLRERDGAVDAILIVLSDSATNRRLVDELRTTLGPGYATSQRAVLTALRHGTVLEGSGVILV